MTTESKWLKGAVNPAHKGFCTPMSKKTCTPRRKALAMRFKHGDLHQDSLVDQLIPAPPLDEHCGHCPEDYARRRMAQLRARRGETDTVEHSENVGGERVKTRIPFYKADIPRTKR